MPHRIWFRLEPGATAQQVLDAIPSTGILGVEPLDTAAILNSEQAQMELRLPAAITGLFQGMLLFFLLGADVLINYRLKALRPARPAAATVGRAA